MNKTKIEWCEHTWNPAVGCKRGCSYCYARRLNNRFKFIPDYSAPTFFRKRLKEPYKRNKPSTIFVGSMSDICYWEPDWISAVIKVCRANPQHTFMFLSKSVNAYIGCKFPDNCMQGLTITELKTFPLQSAVVGFANKNKRPYLSIEPLLGNINAEISSKFELVIVGAMTGRKAVKIKPEWVESAKRNIPESKLFLKDSIKEYWGG